MPNIRVTVNGKEPYEDWIDSTGDFTCYYECLCEIGDKIMFEVIDDPEEDLE